MLQRFPGIENQSSKSKNVITAPNDVSREWVIEVLHRNGIAKATRVIELEVMWVKEVRTSTVCRLKISYDEIGDASLPRSLFLKLPRVLDEKARVFGAKDHAEVQFYKSVAPGINRPPLVRCYDAEHSDDASHILLDDLTETHSQPGQAGSPSVEMSRRAVEALAHAHAPWWGASQANFPHSTAEFDLPQFVENLNRSVSAFLKVVALTSAQRDAYTRMLAAAERIWGRLTRTDHLTVTHGDTHWWNFLYPKDTENHSVYIIDWHLWHVDLGARDLAFLLALGGFAEPRPQTEEDLLHVYHEALNTPGYSWEMLYEDYRWSAIRNLNIPVIFWSQGKHDSTVRDALRRAHESYERLECGSLI